MADVIDSERSKTPNGYVVKSGSVSVDEITDEELKKINKFTLKKLSKEQVFVFKIAACDNGLDDRNYEPFNLNALKDLKKLYVGKTLIKDHARKADNQIARIFDSELIENSTKQTKARETFTTLQLKAYMLRTKSNEDLIAEIEAGIKKEVSTGSRAKHAYCSICGTDNTKTYCPHYHGRYYDTKDGKKQCYFTLDGAKEAYELSLVPVPAQPRAGTTKSYLEDVEENKADENEGNPPQNETEEISDTKAFDELREREVDAYIFTKKQKYVGE